MYQLRNNVLIETERVNAIISASNFIKTENLNFNNIKNNYKIIITSKLALQTTHRQNVNCILQCSNLLVSVGEM